MKKNAWGWIIGSAVFVMIVAVWVWQFPSIIKHAARGTDEGMSGILSVFGGAKASVSADLVKAQKQMDLNLTKVGQAITAQEAKASVIKDLKDKIGEKSGLEAAALPSANANVPALPANTPKPAIKK
jgi:hypothetical protein